MADHGFGKERALNVSVDAVGRFTDAHRSSQQSESDKGGPLSRLRRGEISRAAYLELHIEEAIEPFAKNLGREQLEFMRSALREQLENDPALVELARRATERASSRYR
jgi:hypothetical protein